MFKAIKAVLFDLDGTLTDSGEGIMKSVQYALEKIGHPEPELEKLRCFVGPPLADMFRQYAGISQEEAEEAVKYYRERYAPIGILENRVYEGMEEVLTSLRRKGYVLGVASSKPDHFVRIVLENFGLSRFFDIVTGANLDGSLSKKAEVVAASLQKLEEIGIHKNQVILVGDTRYDVLGAREAGIDCLAVAYGYGDREDLLSVNPLAVADTPSRILDFFV